jgi:predicted TIM-barrel fold metal-dependent hydrolase
MNGNPPPDYNVTGQDYNRRGHFRYSGPPIIDIHAHVTMTNPVEKAEGNSGGAGIVGISNAAETMLTAATEFGIGRTYSMCPPQDIAPLRERFGKAIAFNGPISKKPDEPDEAAYRNLELFLEAGVEIVKLWAAPRGRDRGLLLDTPWRIEALKRARSAGIRVVMAHVGDPDIWWMHTYQDVGKFGTKTDQYVPLRKMLALFPEMTWIGAHMGGDPEHPDHLEKLLEEFPYLHFDTSATKWQVREVSRHRDAIRALVCRYPDRFLFGSDLVTGLMHVREHYVSRYWCQRTLWESSWTGPSPIADPDYVPSQEEGSLTMLRGLDLPTEVLEKVYSGNARRILGLE